jgi:hypothetical protein
VFLADIFNKLNEFSLSVQGHSVTVPTAEDRVSSMKLKLMSRNERVHEIKLVVLIPGVNILESGRAGSIRKGKT